MSSTAFIAYKPGEKPYGPRRDARSWDAHRELLTTMHNSNETRGEMLRVLRSRGFDVSPQQLTRQMLKWNLRVEDLYRVVQRSDSGVDLSQVSTSAALDDLVEAVEPVEVVEPIKTIEIVETAETITPQDSGVNNRLSKYQPSKRHQVVRRKRLFLQSLGAWETFEPSTCCCWKVVDVRAQDRLRSAIWWDIAISCPSETCLKYAVALLYIWLGTKGRETSPEYKTRIRRSLKEYLHLANQSWTPAPWMTDVTRQLSSIFVCLNEWHHSEDSLESQRLRTLSEVRVLLGRLTSGPRVMNDNQRWWPQHRGQAALFADTSQPLETARILSIVQVCEAVLRSDGPALLQSLISEGGITSVEPGIPPSSNTASRAPMELWRIADCIRCFLADMVHQSDLTPLPIAGMSSEELNNTFMAIGYLVAEGLFDAFSRRVGLEGQAESLCLVDLKVSINSLTTSFGMIALREVNGSTVLERFYRAYWVCAIRCYPHYQRQEFHDGSCLVDDFWRLLDTEVTDDKSGLNLFGQKPKQASHGQRSGVARIKWPFSRTRQRGDDVSIRTTSSDNSFTRLQALSLRLGMRESSSSRGSTLSKWSGHYSEEGWRLEDIMQVDEMPSLDSTQRVALCEDIELD